MYLRYQWILYSTIYNGVKGFQVTYIERMNKEDSMEKREGTNDRIEKDEGVFMYMMPRSDAGNRRVISGNMIAR